MSAQRYACEWCGEHIDPGDRVVESVAQARVDLESRSFLTEGEPDVYHERDWTPSFGRERYRGPLRDLRPNAT